MPARGVVTLRAVWATSSSGPVHVSPDCLYTDSSTLSDEVSGSGDGDHLWRWGAVMVLHQAADQPAAIQIRPLFLTRDLRQTATARAGRARAGVCSTLRVFAAVLCVCQALEPPSPTAIPSPLRPRDTVSLDADGWTFELELELARDPPHYDAADESIDIRRDHDA